MIEDIPEELQPYHDLYMYLTTLEHDIDRKLAVVKPKAKKLEKIANAIRPEKIIEEPKDDEFVKKILDPEQRDSKLKEKEIKKRNTPFEQFQEELQIFNKTNAWRGRPKFAKNFITELSKISANNKVIIQNKLLENLGYFNDAMKNFKEIDTSKPNNFFALQIACQKSRETLKRYQDIICKHGLCEKIESCYKELPLETEVDNKNEMEIEISSTKPSYTLHNLREKAIIDLMNYRIKRRVSESLVPIVMNEAGNDEGKSINAMRSGVTAARIIDPKHRIVVYS